MQANEIIGTTENATPKASGTMVYDGFNAELMEFLSGLVKILPKCPARSTIQTKYEEVKLFAESGELSKVKLPLDKFWAACKPFSSVLGSGDPKQMRGVADSVSFIRDLHILPIWDQGMTDQHRYVIAANISKLVWLAERASLASAFDPKLIVAIEEEAMNESNNGDPMRMIQGLLKKGVLAEAMKGFSSGGLPPELDVDYASLMNNTQPPSAPKIKAEKL